MEDQKLELNEEQLKAVDGGEADAAAVLIAASFTALRAPSGSGVNIGEIAGTLSSNLAHTDKPVDDIPPNRETPLY